MNCHYIPCSLKKFHFLGSRLIYQNAPLEGGPTEKENEKQKPRKKEEQEKKQRQYFALGEHEVLDRDKLNKDYVSQISGSVDVVPFDLKKIEKKDKEFFQNEVNKPCELLLRIYTNNKDMFTQSATEYIEANSRALKAMSEAKPQNLKEFSDKVLRKYPDLDMTGPDGVLNLLLAFNRVASKLKPGELDKMASREIPQMLKIDLRHRATRSVEVSTFSPDIKSPDISILKFDTYPDFKVTKRMKAGGTYEVEYSYQPGKGPRSTLLFLQIDPKSKKVLVSDERPGATYVPPTISYTFDEFEKKAKTTYGEQMAP